MVWLPSLFPSSGTTRRLEFQCPRSRSNFKVSSSPCDVCLVASSLTLWLDVSSQQTTPTLATSTATTLPRERFTSEEAVSLRDTSSDPISTRSLSLRTVGSRLETCEDPSLLFFIWYRIPGVLTIAWIQSHSGQWNPDGTLSLIDRIKNLVKTASGECTSPS